MKKNVTIGIFIFILLVIGFYGYRFFIMKPMVMNYSVMHSFDVRDDHMLMENSTEVFVGRVVENKGTIRPFEVAHTLYSVDVISTIKGDVPDQVNVRQQASYEYDYFERIRKIWVTYEDEPPYEEEKLYLFFTLHRDGGEYYTAIMKYGTLPINDKNHQKELVEKYEKVRKENQGKNENKN